jgi:hypothetical protein
VLKQSCGALRSFLLLMLSVSFTLAQAGDADDIIAVHSVELTEAFRNDLSSCWTTMVNALSFSFGPFGVIRVKHKTCGLLNFLFMILLYIPWSLPSCNNLLRLVTKPSSIAILVKLIDASGFSTTG